MADFGCVRLWPSVLMHTNDISLTWMNVHDEEMRFSVKDSGKVVSPVVLFHLCLKPFW